MVSSQRHHCWVLRQVLRDLRDSGAARIVYCCITSLTKYGAMTDGMLCPLTGSRLLWYWLDWGWKPGNYLGSSVGIVFVVRGGRILDGELGVFLGRLEFDSQSPRTREDYSWSSSISKQATHVSTNEYRLNRQTCPGIRSVPTSWS